MFSSNLSLDSNLVIAYFVYYRVPTGTWLCIYSPLSITLAGVSLITFLNIFFLFPLIFPPLPFWSKRLAAPVSEDKQEVGGKWWDGGECYRKSDASYSRSSNTSAVVSKDSAAGTLTIVSFRSEHCQDTHNGIADASFTGEDMKSLLGLRRKAHKWGKE